MKKTLLASMAFFTLTSPAEAYRPFTTDDAGIIEKGKWQLEASWDFSKSAGINQQHVFLLVPGYGATGFLEVAVNVPVVLVQRSGQPLEAGIGDILLAPKFSTLKEQGARPALAALLFFKFDTGDERPRIGTGYRETGILIILSKTLWRFRLNTMIGVDFPVSHRNQKDDTILYGLAVDCHIADIRQKPFYLAAEVFGNTNADPAIKSDPVNLFFGMIYELSQTVSLDTGISIGMTQAAPDLRTTLGAVFPS